MSLRCRQDARRDQVRRFRGRVGLDYLEVRGDQRTLLVYFLGKLPPELRRDRPTLVQYLRVEGGHRIRDIGVLDVDPVVDPSPEKDDVLRVRLDQAGDFSVYTLRLVGIEHVDPRYDHLDFSFKIDCPSDLDCAPACGCEPSATPEPEINYLARDYGTFRQLILDRLSILLPQWKERHVPDLGIALVELLAYTGDYLSYYQDAVATEAYLGTARKRVSVRRHARLVDYLMHEGCNARAWVAFQVSHDLPLDPADMSLITGLNDEQAETLTVLGWDELRDTPAEAYEVFEPAWPSGPGLLQFRAAHSEIPFYTWGDTECCLERGSISATLLDGWTENGNAEDGNAAPGRATSAAHTAPPPARALHLAAGDVLIFEEALGPKTGRPGDADPSRRHAVRLIRVTAAEDPVIIGADHRPTPLLEVEWGVEDALPFSFCISTVGAAPECRYLENVSVARGNVILVDHGRTCGEEDLGTVPEADGEACCECAGRAGETRSLPGQLRPMLGRTPLTFRQALPAGPSASAVRLLEQDPREALPAVRLGSTPSQGWESRYDLLASGPDDRHYVVEIDDEGFAHLRFGGAADAWRPPAGMAFRATYRVGNGTAGNVGAEAISRLVLTATKVDGVAVTVRNPLPARGGTDAEPLEEARLRAPRAFRKRLERAITEDDYRQIAQLRPDVQAACARLAWTGSWYEADVAVDPRGGTGTPDALAAIERDLARCRRMGHDLALQPVQYVPLDLTLDVCALPHYQPGHVKAALLERFSTRTLRGGARGFFHPDNLTFGQGIAVSAIVAAAQAVAGVECVTVTRFQRRFQAARSELADGFLSLEPWEIAQLENDPNFPERGRLEIQVRGGR